MATVATSSGSRTARPHRPERSTDHRPSTTSTVPTTTRECPGTQAGSAVMTAISSRIVRAPSASGCMLPPTAVSRPPATRARRQA